MKRYEKGQEKRQENEDAVCEETFPGQSWRGVLRGELHRMREQEEASEGDAFERLPPCVDPKLSRMCVPRVALKELCFNRGYLQVKRRTAL